MGVLSAVSYKGLFKKNLLAIVCGFTFAHTLAYAHTTCPNLDVSAFCVNGEWQVMSIINDGTLWEFMGEGVHGKFCSNNEHANDVRWNYAFTSARMGLAGCNYSLFDKGNKLIGPIQIKSTYYTRAGTNWENGGYPGNWICRESKENCLFSDHSMQ